jgi:hypothetical protein
MIRTTFIQHLTNECGCLIIRNDIQGYSVARNVVNGKISGIPKDINLRDATVCRVCRTLEVHIPEEAMTAIGVVDLAHSNHHKNNGGE